jgi:tetratricopeptide (TPR) repeat protein
MLKVQTLLRIFSLIFWRHDGGKSSLPCQGLLAGDAVEGLHAKMNNAHHKAFLASIPSLFNCCEAPIMLTLNKKPTNINLALLFLIVTLQFGNGISRADYLETQLDEEDGFHIKSPHIPKLDQQEEDELAQSHDDHDAAADDQNAAWDREEPFESFDGTRQIKNGKEQELLSKPRTLQLALDHLMAGNEFLAEGKHAAAISEWRKAAHYKPDSNVPWNNMANAYMALGDKDGALQAAKEAANRALDYMSSTTLANVYKAKKMYEEAEDVLVRGCKNAEREGERFEHPFWSLSNIYFEQGDYIEALRYGIKGMDMLSHPLCTGPDIAR